MFWKVLETVLSHLEDFFLFLKQKHICLQMINWLRSLEKHSNVKQGVKGLVKVLKKVVNGTMTFIKTSYELTYLPPSGCFQHLLSRNEELKKVVMNTTIDVLKMQFIPLRDLILKE